jgi:hypothetical protein
MARRTHDEVIRKLRALARTADREAIASAFVASLGVAPGFWRAPLCALAAAAAVPTHRYRPFSASTKDCRECGLLPTVVPDEPSERGEILPGDLATALAVLEQVKTTPPLVATAADARRLMKVLATVGTLPGDAREGKLADALRKAKLVAGNRYDARSVIETLGACGVLQTPEHPGFTTRWTSFAARQDRPSTRVECDPPIAFWTAAHGVDAANVKGWFGTLGVAAPASSRPRKVAVAKTTKRLTARAKRAARATELERGDVIAFTVGKAWYAAHVIDHRQTMGGRYPIIQRLDWTGSSAPLLANLRTAPPRPGSMMLDLWARDDRGGRWKTIGRRPAPATKLGGYLVMSLGRDGAGLTRLAQL